MNFTAVRGFSAYAQFTAKIREAVKNKAEAPEEPEIEQDYSHSTYSEPIDIVTISDYARNASFDGSDTPSAPAVILRETSPHVEFREWARTSGVMRGNFTQKIPGSIMNEVVSGSGITVSDDEEFDLNIDVLSAVTITSKNAEKARAIQNLLHTTPSGINWGLLLATLPPS